MLRFTCGERKTYSTIKKSQTIILRNNLWKKSADSKVAYDKQRNYCANLLRRTKKNYFANINISSITDNMETVQPLFLEKSLVMKQLIKLKMTQL